jgi:hypothetical protein
MEDNLWNNINDLPNYQGNKELFQTHLFEQYKLYVAMADKISERRNLTNGFFLTLNTLYLSIIGFMFEKILQMNPKWIIFFILFNGVLLCAIWWWLLKSYRNLNSAKYKVIGHLEKRLPSSPYWSAEWKELGEGKDIKKYFPLSHLENFVPIVFALTYIVFAIFYL